MTHALEDFYERELAFLQESAQLVARRYPAEAGALAPRTDLPADPHLERMIEAFAILSGRIHFKVHNELPELTESFLQILYPHLLRVMPSATTAQFEAKPDHATPGFTVPKGTAIFSKPLGNPGISCQYQTGYPVTLWPIKVVAAQLQPPPFAFGVQAPPRTQAVLRLQLECPESFAKLDLEKLRFYLNGPKQLVAVLYEILFNHTTRVVFRSPDKDAKVPPLVLTAEECLSQVGFERDEFLLPFPLESFEGNRLISEFFYYPEKFHYFDLGGWPRVKQAGFTKKVEVLFFFNRSQANLEQGVNPQTFLLGCTPVINLFARSAEPIALTQTHPEYLILPARGCRHGMEVYSVDSVAGVDASGRPTRDFQAMFTFPAGQAAAQVPPFWYAARRPSPSAEDAGTEMYLTVVDPEFHPDQQADMVLNVQTTCSNRDLPSRFQRAGDPLFVPPDLARAVLAKCLYAPAAPLRPSLRRAAHWRLVTQNALNHMSLANPAEGRAVLQEMLRLCDFTQPGDPLHNTLVQTINGIAGLQVRRVRTRVAGPKSVGVCGGLEYSLSFDEKKYVGVGVFLFACVLERFLALACRVNAFSQLIARIQPSEGIIKKWPPRTMDRQLL